MTDATPAGTKEVHGFDPHGLYTGPVIAYESPLEPGVFPIPAWATEDPPPEYTPGKTYPVRGENGWSVLEDHRGEAWYDATGNKIIIDGLGTVSPDLTPAPPPPTPAQLWAAYQKKAQALLDECNRVALGYFKRGVPFPEPWKMVDAALTAIVEAKSGDPTQPLPTLPTP